MLGWRKMRITRFSLIILQFPAWCAISSQIRFRILGELCGQAGAGRAALQALGRRQPGPKAPFFWLTDRFGKQGCIKELK